MTIFRDSQCYYEKRVCSEMPFLFDRHVFALHQRTLKTVWKGSTLGW
jgi:hypothetical protein